MLARAAAECAAPRPRSGPDPVGRAFQAVVDAMTPGPERLALIGDLAERRPDLVLARAADWLADGDAEVLLRLPAHWFRVAVGGVRRPWSQASIDLVTAALGDDAGAPVVARVMADQYPELTRPSGLDDESARRWHAIGGEVWEWSLWESDDGRYALEAVVSRGHTDFSVAELVDEQLVEQWRRDGPAALDSDIARMRTEA